MVVATERASVLKQGNSHRSQLSFKPQRFGFGATPISWPQGELAYCVPWKAWVVLGARHSWQDDADRVAELAAAALLPAADKGGDSGSPATSSAREEGAATGRERGPWREDGDSLSNLTITAQLPVDGQGNNPGSPAASGTLPRGSVAIALLDELEADSIYVLSPKAGHLLQQQCLTLLLQEPQLTAEGFHTLWKKAPWSNAPSHVQAVLQGCQFQLFSVERVLNYKFSNPLLAVRALTHSSYDPLKVQTSGVPDPHVAAVLAL
jgi:hypothetical protein